jgi:hypothetical protein
MDGLGDVEEAALAADDLPVRHEAQIVQQRYPGAQQFGDPAAVGGGVDMQHAYSAQVGGDGRAATR